MPRNAPASKIVMAASAVGMSMSLLENDLLLTFFRNLPVCLNKCCFDILSVLLSKTHLQPQYHSTRLYKVLGSPYSRPTTPTSLINSTPPCALQQVGHVHASYKSTLHVLCQHACSQKPVAAFAISCWHGAPCISRKRLDDALAFSPFICAVCPRTSFY